MPEVENGCQIFINLVLVKEIIYSCTLNFMIDMRREVFNY